MGFDTGSKENRPGKIIRFYDLGKGNKPQDFNPPESSTYAWPVALSPDNKVMAWGDAGKKIRLWDRPAGKLIGTLTLESGFGVMAFSPDGKTLVSGGNDLVTFWDVATGGDTKTFKKAGYVYNLGRVDGFLTS